MGSILKSAAAMKIGKRHRREGQGEDGSAAMRGYTAGVCAVRGLPVVDRQGRVVLCSVTIWALNRKRNPHCAVLRHDPHALAKTESWLDT